MSYDAKTVLINVVLMSIHTYWAEVFILPKCVLQRIIQICRAFLWEGKVTLNKNPQVAWICRPRVYDGLGVKDYFVWNNVAIGKYVWQVAQKEDVLWIK